MRLLTACCHLCSWVLQAQAAMKWELGRMLSGVCGMLTPDASHSAAMPGCTAARLLHVQAVRPLHTGQPLPLTLDCTVAVQVCGLLQEAQRQAQLTMRLLASVQAPMAALSSSAWSSVRSSGLAWANVGFAASSNGFSTRALVLG